MSEALFIKTLRLDREPVIVFVPGLMIVHVEFLRLFGDKDITGLERCQRVIKRGLYRKI